MNVHEYRCQWTVPLLPVMCHQDKLGCVGSVLARQNSLFSGKSGQEMVRYLKGKFPATTMTVMVIFKYQDRHQRKVNGVKKQKLPWGKQPQGELLFRVIQNKCLLYSFEISALVGNACTVSVFLKAIGQN